MGNRGLTTCLLLTVTLMLATAAASASEFDRAMQPILVHYLKIQQALAADQIEGVESAVHQIEDLARKLDPGMASEDQAERYQHIRHQLLAACAKLAEARDIRSIREAFRELSKPVSMWVSMTRPKGKSVMYCPMADAGWVQEGSEVTNPYFGAEMMGCGQKVGGGETGS